MRNKYGTLPSSFPPMEQLTPSDVPVQHTCKHLIQMYMAVFVHVYVYMTQPYTQVYFNT